MKKNTKKYIASSILASSMIFAVGCNNKSSEINIEQSNENKNLSNNINFEEDSNATYGKVTNINENKITLSLGTMNMGKKQPSNNDSNTDSNDTKPEMPSNEEKPEMSENGEKPEIPSDGERPEMPKGQEKPNNENRPEMITLTGEEKTITIDNNIKIIKKSMKKPNSENEESSSEELLTLSDISVDDILKINYNDDGTTIGSIEIISMGNRDIPKDDSISEK